MNISMGTTALDTPYWIPGGEGDRLPHFDMRLWQALRRRLEAIILEDIPPTRYTVGLTPREFALELTARMYRTQLKDALWLERWAEIQIAANPKPVEQAQRKAAALFGKARARLVRSFAAIKEERHAQPA